MLGRGVFGTHEIGLDVEADAAQRARPHGERLRRRVPLGRHVAGWHGPLLDRDQRPASRAIEHVDVARLADVRDRRHAFAIQQEVEQRSSRRHVRVPDVVMHSLEVPEVLSGLRLDRDDRVAVGVVPGPIAAVVVRRGAADREVDDAPLDVDRCVERPHVGAGAILPAGVVVRFLLAPGVMTRLSGLRDAPELPQLLAGDHVERARIARRSLRDLLRRGPDDRHVAIDRRRAAVSRSDDNAAVVAEAAHRHARLRVNGHQAVAGHEHDARRVRAVARPVAQATLRCRRAAASTAAATGRTATAGGTTTRVRHDRLRLMRTGRGWRGRRGGRSASWRCSRFDRVGPHLLAGIAVDGHDAAAARNVHDAVDDKRHG